MVSLVVCIMLAVANGKNIYIHVYINDLNRKRDRKRSKHVMPRKSQARSEARKSREACFGGHR